MFRPRIVSAVLAGTVILSNPPDLHAETPASELTLRVEVSGLRKANGNIRCLLFAGPTGFPGDPARAVAYDIVKVEAGKTPVCTFRKVHPGRVAVTLIHDENLNGTLDTRWFGIPVEGYGFSNGAQASMFGPPGFEQASARVAQDAVWTVKLVYL